ncbi:MAG: DUF4433 domain-containing protein [Deltaproteobacteria bacterium]|nr:DUF4433 domain-containing protein [Deltaproteobacteria bacterium]
MNRGDISELQNIVHIENVPSIMQHGILSHKRAERIGHQSVAMAEIQDRRKNKQIPGARRLHDYANLYFDAHNPMLSRLRSKNSEICVLRVDAAVLDLPGVIIADQNASSDYVLFSPVASGLTLLDKDRIFARYWKHGDDQIEEWRHKAEKCAEVLVPDCVPSEYIRGAFVANTIALRAFEALNCGLPVSVNNGIFF